MRFSKYLNKFEEEAPDELVDLVAIQVVRMYIALLIVILLEGKFERVHLSRELDQAQKISAIKGLNRYLQNLNKPPIGSVMQANMILRAGLSLSHQKEVFPIIMRKIRVGREYRNVKVADPNKKLTIRYDGVGSGSIFAAAYDEIADEFLIGFGSNIFEETFEMLYRNYDNPNAIVQFIEKNVNKYFIGVIKHELTHAMQKYMGRIYDMTGYNPQRNYTAYANNPVEFEPHVAQTTRVAIEFIKDGYSYKDAIKEAIKTSPGIKTFMAALTRENKEKAIRMIIAKVKEYDSF